MKIIGNIIKYIFTVLWLVIYYSVSGSTGYKRYRRYRKPR